MAGLGRLVVMGGAVRVPGNMSAVAEFNIFVDPVAADVVLSFGLNTLLVPLDVTQQVRLTREQTSRHLGRRRDRLASALRMMTRELLEGRARPQRGRVEVPVEVQPFEPARAGQPGSTRCVVRESVAPFAAAP